MVVVAGQFEAGKQSVEPNYVRLFIHDRETGSQRPAIRRLNKAEEVLN